MHRIAHHDAHNAKAPAEAGKRAEVFALIVPPLQRQNRLRGQAQLVRDGDTDAAVADVEAEITNGFQILTPGLKLLAFSS
jgi:hypothetical protein